MLCTSTGKVRPGIVIDGQSWKYLVNRSACCRWEPKSRHRRQHSRRENTVSKGRSRGERGRGRARGVRQGESRKCKVHIYEIAIDCPDFSHVRVFGRETLMGDWPSQPQPIQHCRGHDSAASSRAIHTVGKPRRKPLPGTQRSHHINADTKKKKHTHTAVSCMIIPYLQGGTHEHHAEVRPPGQKVSQDHQQKVRLQVSLVHLTTAKSDSAVRTSRTASATRPKRTTRPSVGIIRRHK